MTALPLCGYTFIEDQNKTFLQHFAVRNKLGRGSVGLSPFFDLSACKCCNFTLRVCAASLPWALYLFSIKDSDHKALLTPLALISAVIPAEMACLSLHYLLFFIFYFVCIEWPPKDKADDRAVQWRTGEWPPPEPKQQHKRCCFLFKVHFFTSLLHISNCNRVLKQNPVVLYSCIHLHMNV